MRKNSIMIFALGAATLLLSGCSSMLPYRDDFQCEKGKNSGVCSSVSDVYEMSFDMNHLKKQKLDQVECSRGDCEKRDPKSIGSSSLADENRRLKGIVEALEIKKIQESKQEASAQVSSSQISNAHWNLMGEVEKKDIPLHKDTAHPTVAKELLKADDSSVRMKNVKQGRVLADALNIRMEPSATSKRIGYLTKNEIVEIKQLVMGKNSCMWAELKSGGYVSMKWILQNSTWE